MTNTAHTKDHVIHLKDANKIDPNVQPSEHAHELGGAIGMTIGAVAAGLLGAVAGPVGVVVAAAVGGGLGGVVGEEVARDVNPSREEEYWEANYSTRPYIIAGHDYTSYRTAYRTGIDSYVANPKETFDNLEPSLRNNWNIARGNSRLEWAEARHAARDAFSRLSTVSN